MRIAARSAWKWRPVLALACATAAVAANLAAAGTEERAGGGARWRNLEPSILRRTEVGAGRVGGSIYVVGGFLSPTETTNRVERYDIAEDRWSEVAPMPIAVNHPAVATWHRHLYVYGGYTDSSFQNLTAALQLYNPRTDRWRLLRPSPTARGAAAMAAIHGRLYAAGGTSGEVLAGLEIYDIAGNRWHRGPPMRIAREHLAASAAGGNLYVLGGRRPGNVAVGERYNPRTRHWSPIPDMPTARSGFDAVTVKGSIVVFGGEGAETIPAVELFDPHIRRWRSLPPMPVPRHGLGGGSLGRRVFALEGGPSPGFAFSDVAESLKLPGPR
jgi:hypothetical protein